MLSVGLGLILKLARRLYKACRASRELLVHRELLVFKVFKGQRDCREQLALKELLDSRAFRVYKEFKV